MLSTGEEELSHLLDQHLRLYMAKWYRQRRHILVQSMDRESIHYVYHGIPEAIGGVGPDFVASLLEGGDVELKHLHDTVSNLNEHTVSQFIP